jgi:hypothetical protein
MRIGAVVLVALATAGCSSATTTTPAISVMARPPATGGLGGKPYRLYTHCGIAWARIDGTFWRATRPLSDGNTNPPPGWGNPVQEGTLTLKSRTTAEFSSPAGSITFERTGRTEPPFICS